MVMRISRVLSILLAVAVGGALFAYAFHGIRLGELVETLSGFSPGWLPVLAALPFMDLFIRAVRWRLLLAPVVRAGVWELFQFEAIGLAINNILFLRVGELARGVVAGQELGVHTLSVLATIVVERLCDTAALMGLFVAGSFLLHEGVDPWLRGMALALFLAIVLVLALITAAGARFRESAPWLSAHPRTSRVLEDLILGTRALRSWPSALGVAGLSLGLWFCDAGIFWAASRGMGFAPPMSWVDSMITLTIAAVGTALPAVPGAFGNYEATVCMALQHLGYPRSLALSLATFVHVLGYVIVTSVGITFLYRLGHTFSSLRRVLHRDAAAAGEPRVGRPA
jgi:uncharacterized protein (TIRG00374 family)